MWTRWSLKLESGEPVSVALDPAHDQLVALLFDVAAHPVQLQHRDDPVGLLQPHVGDVGEARLALGELAHRRTAPAACRASAGSRSRPRAAAPRRGAPARRRPRGRAPSAAPSRRRRRGSGPRGGRPGRRRSRGRRGRRRRTGWIEVAARPKASEPMSGGRVTSAARAVWSGSISKRRQSSATPTSSPKSRIMFTVSST